MYRSPRRRLKLDYIPQFPISINGLFQQTLRKYWNPLLGIPNALDKSLQSDQRIQ